MSAIVWTEAHRLEVRARRHEIAAVTERAGESIATTGHTDEAGREVRRVDGLATGRKVRETVERWDVALANGRRCRCTGKAQALRSAKLWSSEPCPIPARAVKVIAVHIRRAT